MQKPTLLALELLVYSSAHQLKLLQEVGRLKAVFLTGKWNDSEKWKIILYFEIHQAPSEIPANLQGQLSLSGQIVLHWAAANLKGLDEFQNEKI